MSGPEVEWLGTSCGKHGSYTFYKGFKLTANGQTKKYLLGEFYFVRNSKDRPICIAELQLVWHDANTGNQLASARLYFRPEATPGGRQNTHGKDELLYTDEKVVVKCRDMINLECDASDWCYGMKAISELSLQEVKRPRIDGDEGVKKYRMVCKNNVRAKNPKNMAMKERTKIVILSFPAYCRYKSLMKKLTNGLVLSRMAIIAFGGIIQNNNCTWVSFSRESFHHPELDKFDMFSDNKAPVLKGRPRKKKTSKGAGKGQTKSKHKLRKNDDVIGQNIPDERSKSPESESSDENQTDTSDDNSSGIPELPCPPKLVSAIKEEPSEPVNQGVIRSVKHSDVQPVVIPPIPKLVKIEPKPAGGTPSFKHFHQSPVKVETIPQSTPVSICRMENIGAIKLTSTPPKMNNTSSVISSAYNTNNNPQKSIYRPINNVLPHENARVQHKVPTRVSHELPVSASPQNHSIATILPSSVKTTHVPQAGTITTNRTIRPRMSAIVSTGLERVEQVATNRAVPEKKPGSERHMQCPNDMKQTLKRKRGRPPGKSTKFIKVQEVKSEDRTVNKPSPLRPVEMNVSPVAVKSEPLPPSPVKNSMVVEDQDSPESEDASERAFMNTLKNFMKKRGTPIEKIPALGFRKINLFKMFDVTRALGGYDVVTAKRLWRRVYNEVGGSPSITSAATNSRKHYERLLLPYERYTKGQDPLIIVDKPDISPPGNESEKISTSKRDQNANVIKKEHAVVLIPQKPAKKQPKPVASVSECIVFNSDDTKPSVEFISSGSRGSPIMLYSSQVEQQTARHKGARESPTVSVTYETRPRVITSVGRDRTRDERSSTPEVLPNDMRSFIPETVDDELRMYLPPKPRKNDVITSIADHERKYEYAQRMPVLERVNELRTHVQESRSANDRYALMRSTTPEITNESRDTYKKVSRDRGDGVLMMNVRMSDGKSRSNHTHSPRPLDEQYISTFAVPVLQQSPFPHGVELYDLPNGGFPLRTSSRVFMPSPRQMYPSSSHPSATLSPYPPHIITAIGPETGAVYQLPMPGYFPQELPYQLDGVSILRS